MGRVGSGELAIIAITEGSNDSRDVSTVPSINGTYSQSSVICGEKNTSFLSESLFDHIDDTAFRENIRLESELIELYISQMNVAEPDTRTHIHLSGFLVSVGQVDRFDLDNAVPAQRCLSF
jgi:hypothetical protein